MLEYLDAVHKLILSWNLRGRSYGEVNRQNKKQFGTVASKLLHHINQLKDDRIKSGADLIIQSARGFVPSNGGKGWVKKHNPCRVILFEDLARYRFRVDRPRRENSQLMKWNHRNIIAEASMQAELYGMVIEITAAGFSSRFLASSGAPGERCRYLKADDFENELPKEYVLRELEWMLGATKSKETHEKQQDLKGKIRSGMLVPWSGGEQFASLNENGDAHIIHADLNAAQNLQRRFWSRCGDAFRMVCKNTKLDGEDTWELEKPPGVRLLGAFQQMRHGDKPFFLRETEEKVFTMHPSSARKRLKAGTEENGELDELEEALAGVDDDSGGGRETFFRDPSGIVTQITTSQSSSIKSE